MNKTFIILFSLLFTTISHSAREITFEAPSLNMNSYSLNQSNQQNETHNDDQLIKKRNTNNSYGTSNSYNSSFGNSYQYDLNNPSDRTRYSTDLDAQRRDQMDLTPSRNLERGVGQYGGGILNND